MKPWIRVIVIVAAVVGIFMLVQFSRSPEKTSPTSSNQVESNITVTPETPSADQALPPETQSERAITNYDECIAVGNPPLPDAPDKCLTKGGHVFIRDVIE